MTHPKHMHWSRQVARGFYVGLLLSFCVLTVFGILELVRCEFDMSWVQIAWGVAAFAGVFIVCVAVIAARDYGWEYAHMSDYDR